ncbi:MAG: SGNH/GDSL hydrolase family protein [Ekhidna sp.]|nr:SGNH/GDSL hydrolase family protein [Ekhidna sp.]MBC6410272.1 SGNH/GDSL hydrolase family protein [Ekhidna sp.]MBC6425331.1 SGNH/GDSL hydrolase family protein [Ekhidna sp.]
MKFLYIFLFALLSSCNSETKRKLDIHKKYTLLALGDSYTIGESVAASDRWPAQLSAKLKKDSITLEPTIVANTGWTTDELISGITKSDVTGTFDLVSLLIGVNNQYRGYDEDQYEKEFKVLLDKAIKFANGNNHHVFVMSIPDYGITSFAEEKGLDAAKIAHELDSYNAIAQKIATLRDVSFINITPISRKADKIPDLTAADGLHPSGRMYGMWVDYMYEQVYKNLSSI